MCASADEPTAFVFDSRVAVGAVEFQPVGRLAQLEGAGVVASMSLGFLTVPPANALRLVEARSYSYTPTGETHPASVAVRLLLKNPGAEPWTLAGAALMDSAGEQVELQAGP